MKTAVDDLELQGKSVCTMLSNPIAIVSLFTALVAVGAQQELEASRVGRKLSTLCHFDNCGIWCGPPRTGRCAKGYKKPDYERPSRPAYRPKRTPPPCYAPTKVDCYAPDYSDSACYDYCGDNPYEQDENQCGGYTYVCHDPPCPEPRTIDCYPPNYDDDDDTWSDAECSNYCDADGYNLSEIPYSEGKCPGDNYVCHAKPPCPAPEEIFCPYDSDRRKCKKFCGPDAKEQDIPRCGGKIVICEAPPPVETSPPEKGCFAGDSLGFGLENCLCDGVAVGQPAGLAACGRVLNECGSRLRAFSSGSLEAVQRVCDTFALDACISSAQNAIFENPGCGEILQDGTERCSPEEAQRIFLDSVERTCDPICPDCVRAED